MKPTLSQPAAQGSSGSRRGPALVLVGTDFRLAPLDLREKVALNAEEVTAVLGALLEQAAVEEAFVLSTCNRTEVYVQPRDQQAALETVVRDVFAARSPQIQTQGRLAVRWHGEAASHLLSVASGLESMVLGEPEILGQVKQAASAAEVAGAAGPVLSRLLRCAIGTGKRVRSETDVAGGAVSFGYAAVELARNIFSHLDRTRVLIVGAGGIARQVGRSLLDKGAGAIDFCNRSAGRAEALRDELGKGRVLPYEDLGDALGSADLVVASTSAEEPVIGPREMHGARLRRRSQPLLLIDLGVPRNVAPEVGGLENVFLHDIDSLKHLIERNLRRRREEVPQVREIIHQELEHFFTWYGARTGEPVVAQIQRRAESIRTAELTAAFDQFPPQTHPQLERLTRSLVRKLLHHPSQRLRRRNLEAEHVELIRDLFQLDDGSDD